MQSHSKRDAVISIIIVVVIYCAAFALFATNLTPNGDRTVYVTNTGECYHSSSCSSLRYSKFQRTLEYAVNNGYRSCSNCDPPDLIRKDRNFKFPWWAFIVLTPPIAYCGWIISAFILPIFRVDMDNISLSALFLTHIVLAFLLLIALHCFL